MALLKYCSSSIIRWLKKKNGFCCTRKVDLYGVSEGYDLAPGDPLQKKKDRQRATHHHTQNVGSNLHDTIDEIDIHACMHTCMPLSLGMGGEYVLL